MAARVVATGNRRARRQSPPGFWPSATRMEAPAWRVSVSLKMARPAKQDEIADDWRNHRRGTANKRRLRVSGTHARDRAVPCFASLTSSARPVGRQAGSRRRNRVLSSNRPIPLNVDGAIAGILFDLEYPALAAKLMFIIGRTAGLSAHVIEEYSRERAMRIRIPVTYDGPQPTAAK
jgi:hypothetical protein